MLNDGMSAVKGGKYGAEGQESRDKKNANDESV